VAAIGGLWCAETMATIVYTDVQIVKMTSEQVGKLGTLCPKKVYFQMETSGSPSAWTNNGEYLAGTKGADIVRCARDIRAKHAECEEYNRACGYGDNRRSYDAHIRVIF